MPFTGPGDRSLPDSIKKLPVAKRRQWVSVFNSTFKRCRAGKLPAPPGGQEGTNCEARSFAIANGVLKKKEYAVDEGNVPDVDNLTDDELIEAEKHGDFSEAAVYHSPYEGLSSFAEFDKLRKAQQLRGQREDSVGTFRLLFDNIWDNEEKTVQEKVRETKRLETELLARVANPQRFALKQVPGKVGGLAHRVGDFLLGSADIWPGPGRNDDIPPTDTEEDGRSPSAFFLIRDKSGALRYLTIASNKFYDREGEVFPEEAHKEYIEYADKAADYPELRLWHVPGTRIGQADFVAYNDGFCLSSGVIDNDMETVAKSLTADDVAVSQGFRYRESDFDGETYSRYRRFEESILPASKAANPWTAFTLEGLVEEVAMPLAKDKRAFLVGHLGEERVAKLEVGMSGLKEELEAAGIGFKEVIEAALADAPDQAVAASNVAVSPGSASDDEGEAGSADDKPADEKPADEKLADEEAATAATALTEVIGKAVGKAVADAVAPLQASVSELQEGLKELQRSDDETVADQMAPKGKPGAANGKRPTESEKNVIDGERAKELAGAGASKDGPGATQEAAQPYVEQFLLGKAPAD